METFNAPIQAPKAGIVSPLNGEFYKGGQFTPSEVGWPKGASRKLAKALSVSGSKSRNIARIIIKAGWVRLVFAGESREKWVFSGSDAECREFAERFILEKAKQYRESGFEPHPTEICIWD